MEKASFLKSFYFALKGLKSAFKTERNLRIHFTVVIFIIAAGMLFRVKLMEWVALFLVIGLVIVTELLNTAIEAVVDLYSPDFHPLAAKAKDSAAAAVLIAAIIAVITGLFVFLPHLF